jgi:hypothetical protein
MTATTLHGFLAIITRHWLSSVGAGLVTTSAICWLLVLPSQMRGHVSNPYIGILLFVILPIAFIGGLLLIPFGVYLSRRRVRKGLSAIDMDRPTMMRRLAILVAVTTSSTLSSHRNLRIAPSSTWKLSSFADKLVTL